MGTIPYSKRMMNKLTWKCYPLFVPSVPRHLGSSTWGCPSTSWFSPPQPRRRPGWLWHCSAPVWRPSSGPAGSRTWPPASDSWPTTRRSPPQSGSSAGFDSPCGAGARPRWSSAFRVRRRFLSNGMSWLGLGWADVPPAELPLLDSAVPEMKRPHV